MVGDFDSAATLKSIEKVFGLWTGKKPPTSTGAELPRPKGRHVYVVHVPGAVQAQILIGCHSITRKNRDWVKLGLTNSLFGGAFNSRLVMNIREDKGYTYSPRSSVHPLQQHGYFTISAAVRSDVVAASLTEMFYELNKLRALPVPEQELADARNYLSGIFSMGLATQNGLLSQLATIALNDLPDDYLETYRDKLKSLTPSDVLASARKWFTSPDMQIVVVGDRAQIQEQATLFGETTVYDATGTVI
jgi:predicted Zn-dependent peptidase